MQLRTWLRIALATLPLLAGCDGFWQNPNSSTSNGGCTTSCTTDSSGNFYTLSAASSPVIAGQFFSSGSLKSISGSPFTAPATPYSIAIAPSGKYLYVSTTAGVYVYPISSGVLGSYAQVTQDAAALAIHLDTTGGWLLEALQSSGAVTLAAVPLSSTTGLSSSAELTATYTVSNSAIQSGAIAVSSDDKFVFVALGAGGSIAVPFNASAGSGVNPFGATAYTIPVLNSGGSALSIAVDPTGRLFYIGETLANSTATSGGVRAFNYSSLGASLTQASGSPIASGGLAPRAIQPNSNGTYVYVANGAGTSSGNITSFAITTSGSAYTISTGSTIATGVLPYGLAIDSSSNFLLAVNNSGNPDFYSYTFDSTTAGKLDVQVVSSSTAPPIAIVAAP